MIKPQVPPEIKLPKIKDTEGLGGRIPTENVGAIASTIVLGGLTGSAAAAGEELLTGGLSVVLNAGERIAGASIGGAVGSGTSYALGGGPAAQVVSSIAGGIKGKTAVKAMRNRKNNTGERQPLLLLENGNRVGGNRSSSRLVDTKISQPITEE
jgi:hypothetical protein